MANLSYLDSPEAIDRVGAGTLLEILRQFPEQLEQARKEFFKVELPSSWRSCREVVFCGMGGSAIGGEVASDLPARLVRKPLFVVREYNLPQFVGPQSLVVVVSYSGDTEEPLSCFKEAMARGCHILAITSGGKLAREASVSKIPCYKFDYKAPPRDAFGYLFAPLAHVLEWVGVLEQKEANINSAIDLVKTLAKEFVPEVPTENNKAKTLAYLLYDHVPLIISSSVLHGVARRWKDQFNEHSKSASFFDVLPELNHNTVEGFEFPSRFRDDVAVVLLGSNYDHPEVSKRFSLFKNLLNEKKIVCQTPQVNLPEHDFWTEKLSLVLLGDWVSFYLALLYRVDPSAIPNIDGLKKQLRS